MNKIPGNTPVRTNGQIVGWISESPMLRDYYHWHSTKGSKASGGCPTKAAAIASILRSVEEEES